MFCCQCYQYDVSVFGNEHLECGSALATKAYSDALTDIGDVSFVEKEAVLLIENGYVDMLDYQYYITISKSEAKVLGYSEEAYECLSYNLELGNEMLRKLIEEWEKDSTISTYSIQDVTCKDLDFVLVDYSLKNRSEVITFPSGVLRASGQEVVETKTYFPHEARGVFADCMCAAAPMGVNVVYTRVMDTVFSESCVYRGAFTVNIAASGTNVTVAYQTTDSYGGTCAWHAYGNNNVE